MSVASTLDGKSSCNEFDLLAPPSTATQGMQKFLNPGNSGPQETQTLSTNSYPRDLGCVGLWDIEVFSLIGFISTGPMYQYFSKGSKGQPSKR